MALTTDDPRAATVIASTKVHAGEIHCDDFKKLLGSQSPAASKVALNIARVLATRVNFLLERLSCLCLDDGTDEDATELAAFRQQVFSEWSF
jgi:CRP-like cAMP-binding protein